MSTRAKILKALNILMPLALGCWVIDWIAREWGIFGVVMLCAGLGALTALIYSIRTGLTVFQTYRMTRFGTLPGLLVGLLLAPVLSLIGYQADTTESKARSAAVNAIHTAMTEPGDVPLDELRPGVQQALNELPDHPIDRSESITNLLTLLDDPDPLVRSQTLLALGHYEGYAERLLPVYDAALKSTNTRQRAAALVSLTKFRPFTSDMLSRFLPLLHDRDPDVRQVANAAAPEVRRLLRDEDLPRLIQAEQADDPADTPPAP